MKIMDLAKKYNELQGEIPLLYNVIKRTAEWFN